MKWNNAFDVTPSDPDFFLVAIRECGSLGTSEYVTMAHLDNDGRFYWYEGDKLRLNGDDFYVLAWADMPEFPKRLEE